jgi:hypothetical protein
MVNSSIVITEGSSNSPETPTAEQADTPMRHHDRHGTTPESTKTSLRQRLLTRARERWPQLATLHVRHRGAFAYVDGELPGGATMPLFRLRYGGSATAWAFATYRASHKRLPDLHPAQQIPRWHTTRSPRLRLRPLPQRRRGLAIPELTGAPTS